MQLITSGLNELLHQRLNQTLFAYSLPNAEPIETHSYEGNQTAAGKLFSSLQGFSLAGFGLIRKKQEFIQSKRINHT